MNEYQRLVLLVDDEEAVRGVLRDALVTAGFTVLEAGNYEEGVRAARPVLDALQLMIIDVSLPGRNGCELANELKRHGASIPSLFISGYTGAEVCRAYNISITDVHFLAKPFHPRDLVERVELLLRQSGSTSGEPIRRESTPRQPHDRR